MDEAPLSYSMLGGKLVLAPEGIHYRNEMHPYSAVAHLGRYASRTSFYFIPVIDFLRLRIHVRGREKPITVQNGIGLAFTTSGLQRIYDRLVDKTFAQRATGYLRQLETQGHFAYGGARFFQNGEVELNKHKYDLRSAKLWLQPFHLQIKEDSVFALKRKIDAETDKDVFLALLQKLYGITFKD